MLCDNFILRLTMERGHADHGQTVILDYKYVRTGVGVLAFGIVKNQRYWVSADCTEVIKFSL